MGNKIRKLYVILELHIAIHDVLGNNSIIEFVNGNVNLYDYSLGY